MDIILSFLLANHEPVHWTIKCNGWKDLASEVRRLYDEWQPQTDEGRRYRDDLGEVIGISATDPGPSPDYPPAHEFE